MDLTSQVTAAINAWLENLVKQLLSPAIDAAGNLLLQAPRLDTVPVVVRLLVGVPDDQAQRAKERLEQALAAGHTLVVTDLAIDESYHALHHHYGMPKPQARALLERFVASGIVRLDPQSSLPALAHATGAGLVDRLIHARHRALAAITLTFDRRHAQLEGAERLEAD